MPHFQMDDAFSDSKEVLALPRKYRLECVGLFALCGCWSANKLLDGFVPDEQLKKLGGRKILVDLLAGITGPDGEDWSLIEFVSGQVSSGIRIKNWPKWQKTRDEVLAYRKAEADRKKRERDAKKQRAIDAASRNGELSGSDTPAIEAPQANSRPPGHPGGIRPPSHIPSHIPKEEITECANSPVGSGPAPTHTDRRPSPNCDRHPQGTRQRCGDCANARRQFEEWQEAEDEFEQRRADANDRDRRAIREAIDNCPQCDAVGRLDDLSPCPNHLTLADVGRRAHV